MAVFAAIDSGTRRANDCTADISVALEKIGSVMDGGSRVDAAELIVTGMIALSV
jgi:hypothetical protein